jgi:(N-acetylneuraminyl)-galactosylglucosylceramide N-acetylgalactosaminyltransferase
VTAVIKTICRPESLRRLLLSIRDFYPDLRILIADDSPEPYPEVAREIDPTIQYHVLPTDAGAGESYNRLMEFVTTEHVLMLDDDFELSGETDLVLMEDLLYLSEIDLLGGRIFQPDGTEHNYEFNLSLNDDIMYCHTVKRSPIEVMRCDTVLNFWMARTEAVKVVGWDDRQKIMRHLDFFFRTNKGKLKVGFTPQVGINHFPAMNDEYLQYRHGAERVQEHIVYFLEKWGLEAVLSDRFQYRRRETA